MHSSLNAEVARLIDARIATDLERRRVVGLARQTSRPRRSHEPRTPLAWLVSRVTGRPPVLPSAARRA